ncbi:Arv1-like protein [Bimuria novae-zelandiae CBS 107.79]|uniref:Protein ARV n=1 Tax=Bimuria novae-zelandiae CBS 107.79 TaxID=1447943 RepID=A0A6A5VTR6_9PLEO|nr:Arv1-like protein [Bimuria novae-zelandiae CBS 107.79]
MPICIECRAPIKTLYTTYSKADDRALGKGVRLTQCPRCKRFADKYVEHDFVVIFIDMVLIKPQVYRHLLFNSLSRDDGRFDRSILRLGTLLLLFDVYLTWARIEKLSFPPSSSSHQHALRLHTSPLLAQYAFFLLLVSLSTIAFHAPIRLLTSLPPSSFPPPLRTLIPYYPHPNAVSTALLVSSCTKLFPILLIIWEYDLRRSAAAVGWAVLVNNVAALEILVGCGYGRAGAVVGVGAVMRAGVQGAMLTAVGLEGVWEYGLVGEVVRVGRGVWGV